ncbi:hypothetical protein [Edaphobacter bradus]|uniref:hypothetical protein n=1 Tax=Edaphobacter bradus TaxID=2259016 RepID=UPI0021DFEB4A|nr:hypothetical protein [Edaphobacter bradus]
MNKAVLYLLLILIGLSPSTPAVAHADTNSARQAPQHSSVKASKAYMKDQKKQLKKSQKQQAQAIKKWRKQHGVTH